MQTTTNTDMNLTRPTITRLVTHEQGSWKWQPRYALVRYVATWSVYKQAWLWKSDTVLDNKVTPKMRREIEAEGVAFGSLHNRPVAVN